jgi:hypothetical protein
VTEQDRNKAWGFALFADDLRAELGGKTSLMGIYQSDMLFPGSMKLPFAVPKFVTQVMYYETIGAIKDDVAFRVTFGPDNRPIAEAIVPRKDLPIDTGNESSGEEAERIIHLRLPLVLSPFVITEAGRLRVRAHYSDGTILKLGSIAIKLMPDDEFQTITGLPVAPAP